jgi:hypothetical protein
MTHDSGLGTPSQFPGSRFHFTLENKSSGRLVITKEAGHHERVGPTYIQDQQHMQVSHHESHLYTKSYVHTGESPWDYSKRRIGCR